ATLSPDEIHSPTLPSTASVAARSCAFNACTSAFTASSGEAYVLSPGAAARAPVAIITVTSSTSARCAQLRAAVPLFQRSTLIVISMAIRIASRSANQRLPPPPRPPPPPPPRPPPPPPPPRAPALMFPDERAELMLELPRLLALRVCAPPLELNAEALR